MNGPAVTAAVVLAVAAVVWWAPSHLGPLRSERVAAIAGRITVALALYAGVLLTATAWAGTGRVKVIKLALEHPTAKIAALILAAGLAVVVLIAVLPDGRMSGVTLPSSMLLVAVVAVLLPLAATSVPGAVGEQAQQVTGWLRAPSSKLAGFHVGGQSKAAQAVNVAMAQRGRPYFWGGEKPSDPGFDCSGLIQYAYDMAGVALPRLAEEQARVGRPVGRNQVRPGDLIFYREKRRGPIDHVGMAIGGGRMVVAPHAGAVVRVEPNRVDTAAAIRRVV